MTSPIYLQSKVMIFITVSEFTLKEAIRQTIFSIADNDTNKLMTGELFEINENRLRVVSLDGPPHFYP